MTEGGSGPNGKSSYTCTARWLLLSPACSGYLHRVTHRAGANRGLLSGERRLAMLAKAKV